ncbi:MAG: DUF998 domain-containing protein [Actinomycetota bacterium]
MTWRGATTVAVGLGAAVANAAFLWAGVAGSRLDPVHSVISDLAARDQPTSLLIRGGDVVGGLLVAVLAGLLWRQLPPGRAGRGGCAALAVFGLGGTMAGLVPMDCAISASGACRAQDLLGGGGGPDLLHAAASAGSDLAGVASLGLLGWQARGRRGWSVVAGLGLGGVVVLGALSALVGALAWHPTGPVGLLQRIQQLGFSAWLLALALALAAAGPACRG